MLLFLRHNSKQHIPMKSAKFFSAILFAALVALSSCKKEEEEEEIPVTPTPSGTVVVTQNISANTTWSNDQVYQLGGRIVVLDGVYAYHRKRNGYQR
jgi:hypothetical protein